MRDPRQQRVGDEFECTAVARGLEERIDVRLEERLARVQIDPRAQAHGQPAVAHDRQLEDLLARDRHLANPLAGHVVGPAQRVQRRDHVVQQAKAADAYPGRAMADARGELLQDPIRQVARGLAEDGLVQQRPLEFRQRDAGPA